MTNKKTERKRQMLNNKNEEIISRSKAEAIAEAKRKENYEADGIPVERLFLCSGLPMNN